MYNKMSRAWTSMRGMPTSRWGLACGRAINAKSGDVEIVAAGGESHTDIVEIYTIRANTWRTAKHRLPSKNRGLTGVPYGQTFMVVGGDTGSYSDMILLYKPDTEGWETLGQRMTTGRYHVSATLVNSKSFKNCTN